MNNDTNTANVPARPTAPAPVGLYRPKLTFYHPNGKGSGSAVEMELHPAHDRTSGSIMLRMANQMTVGDRRGPNPTFPRFDWENAISVKLDFTDLCKILQVFRGECEAIDEGRGLYHRSPRASTRIALRHLIEPTPGYSFELYRTQSVGDEENRARILFNPAEALGLCESIAGALYLVSFGIPMLIPHDTSVYLAETKEMRRAVAAA